MSIEEPGAGWMAERVKALEEELADIKESFAITINEQCSPDEKHCTCVPALRDEIERLRGALECERHNNKWSGIDAEEMDRALMLMPDQPADGNGIWIKRAWWMREEIVRLRARLALADELARAAREVCALLDTPALEAAERDYTATRPRGCALVGCTVPGPHEHDIGGPVTERDGGRE